MNHRTSTSHDRSQHSLVLLPRFWNNLRSRWPDNNAESIDWVSMYIPTVRGTQQPIDHGVRERWGLQKAAPEQPKAFRRVEGQAFKM